MTAQPPILQVRNLTKEFRTDWSFLGGSRQSVRAVSDVSFDVMQGETLSIVGESGCGKTTLGRAILGLAGKTEGEIRLQGQRVDSLGREGMRNIRRRLQVVFQDPFGSMNPRMRVGEIIGEPIVNFGLAAGAALAARIAELLEAVNLPASAANRYPHEFSGGQRQRICIARALSTRPEVIICDEAVSALDVSVKAQIVNLLITLQKQMGLTLIFISHDLAIVEHLSTRVAVMYLGKIVEIGSRREIFGAPSHPYTRALLSAIPVPDPRDPGKRIILRGEIPSPLRPPVGCKFNTRCPLAFDRCRSEEPALRSSGPNGQLAACHLAGDGAPAPAIETAMAAGQPVS